MPFISPPFCPAQGAQPGSETLPQSHPRSSLLSLGCAASSRGTSSVLSPGPRTSLLGLRLTSWAPGNKLRRLGAQPGRGCLKRTEHTSVGCGGDYREWWGLWQTVACERPSRSSWPVPNRNGEPAHSFLSVLRELRNLDSFFIFELLTFQTLQGPQEKYLRLDLVRVAVVCDSIPGWCVLKTRSPTKLSLVEGSCGQHCWATRHFKSPLGVPGGVSVSKALNGFAGKRHRPLQPDL